MLSDFTTSHEKAEPTIAPQIELVDFALDEADRLDLCGRISGEVRLKFKANLLQDSAAFPPTWDAPGPKLPCVPLPPSWDYCLALDFSLITRPLAGSNRVRHRHSCYPSIRPGQESLRFEFAESTLREDPLIEPQTVTCCLRLYAYEVASKGALRKPLSNALGKLATFC